MNASVVYLITKHVREERIVKVSFDQALKKIGFLPSSLEKKAQWFTKLQEKLICYLIGSIL